MSNQVTKAVELIYQMNNDELNQIVEAIKLKRTHLARTMTRSVNVGDTVSFKGRGGKMVQGTVKKVNRKTLIVSEGFTNWRVTASLVEKVMA